MAEPSLRNQNILGESTCLCSLDQNYLQAGVGGFIPYQTSSSHIRLISTYFSSNNNRFDVFRTLVFFFPSLHIIDCYKQQFPQCAVVPSCVRCTPHLTCSTSPLPIPVFNGTSSTQVCDYIQFSTQK